MKTESFLRNVGILFRSQLSQFLVVHGNERGVSREKLAGRRFNGGTYAGSRSFTFYVSLSFFFLVLVEAQAQTGEQTKAVGEFSNANDIYLILQSTH